MSRRRHGPGPLSLVAHDRGAHPSGGRGSAAPGTGPTVTSTTLSLAPLLGAPLPVQLHAAAGALALLVGLARLMRHAGESVAEALDWSFLGLLCATALSSLLLPAPLGAPTLWGMTPHHAFTVFALVGTGAAVFAQRQGWRLARRRIVSAAFGGILVMAGLFEVLPGRLLNAVLAGG